MVMVIGSQERFGPIEIPESSKRRRNPQLPLDTSLARLGSEVSPPLGDLAMIFTDICNSTLLWESAPVVMRAAIKTHNSIMRRTIRLIGGYEVKTEGDAFVVAFQTPPQALLWCITVQQQLLTAEWPDELLSAPDCMAIYDDDNNILFRGLRVRMGIHWGRPVHEQDPITGRMDYFGPMVNRAARISAIAYGGQVALSHDFLNAVRFLELAHTRSKSNPVPEAYNLEAERAAELDRRVVALQAEGYVTVEVGELKLKGIENLEFIYIAYPQSLRKRAQWDYSDEARPSGLESLPPVMSNNAQITTRKESTVASASVVLSLQEICERLEILCESTRTGKRRSSASSSIVGVQDPTELVNGYMTRIENSIAALTLHHAAQGIDFSDLLRQLSQLAAV